jgi:cysteine desulfurase
MASRIYLDHAATTLLHPAARAAMMVAFDGWANPSSPHGEGRGARAMLEAARRRIADALGWEGAVLFTSGASEGIATVFARAGAGRRLVSVVEHDAVLRAAGDDVLALPVTADGLVRSDALAAALGGAGDRPLVAIQLVNSETGVIQPAAGIGAAVRAAGGLWLCDATQGAGKMALPDADFLVLSAHKFGGPPGIGALLVRDLATLAPSGGQEQGYRGGTENVPGAAGMAAALEEGADWIEAAAELRAECDAAIEAAGGIVIARGAPRLPTIASYRMPGVPAAAQLIRLDLAGFAVSAGSACSSGSLKPSHVLAAMGMDEAAAGEVIRVSFGRDTSREDIRRFAESWRTIVLDAKARAA